MCATNLQVTFAKFLIVEPETSQIFDVDTRTNHFEVEGYFKLPIFSNIFRLSKVPLLATPCFVDDVNLNFFPFINRFRQLSPQPNCFVIFGKAPSVIHFLLKCQLTKQQV
jgi:hypothetical protein